MTGVAGSSADPAALSGLRIADFSRILAGPFATMILADLGAEAGRPGWGQRPAAVRE